MANLDDILTKATKARLIPNVADTHKEERIVSILLATLSVVRPFAERLLKRFGVNMGKTSDLRCYSEVNFPESESGGSGRVDGILSLTTRRNRWTAILEAKVDNEKISKDQVDRYAKIARDYGINAVVTLSNQLVPLATHLPYLPPKQRGNRIEFFHISWISVLTEAALILNEKRIGNDITQDQAFILDEMNHYMEDRKSGVKEFDRMNEEWGRLVRGVGNGTKFKRNAPEIENTITSWHQEERDVCLMLSRCIGEYVDIRLSRKHKENRDLRHQEACAKLTNSQELRCAFSVPNAASDLEVVANLQRRTISCSMKLSAPDDKKRASARINWLRQQLKAVDGGDVIIRAIWQGQGGPQTEALLSDVQRGSKCLEREDASGTSLRIFEVLMIRDLAGRFSGSKKFIENLEELIPEFYDRIGQHLKPWTPPPPSIEKRDPVRDTNVIETSNRDNEDDIPQSELNHPTDPFPPGSAVEGSLTRYLDRAPDIPPEPDDELLRK